ncbi:hypothetical protein Amsp01_094320 [Amycolatopsis sp. NBRC 101858]|uniref:hypothetical protein n=1 Tax=Amycolatopsis sp. NBRC 101858 TaxID=3032200 RepID=UPI0024A27FB0|nr:hypothetical protein [Amycolatopsis sp. NBRC 101858]GLY43409.1 hypothetical protein Amsp01_094320 [Amycolatopsis sp. NBRC 101858]
MPDDPWFLRDLAPDVLLAGSIMNGSLRGADAVAEQIRTVIGFYRDYTPRYRLEVGDRTVQEYTATVDGRPITGVGTFHVNEAGQVDEIVVNHRPLSALLTLSRLLGESAIGERARDEFFHADGQTHQDLLDHADKAGREL